MVSLKSLGISALLSGAMVSNAAAAQLPTPIVRNPLLQHVRAGISSEEFVEKALAAFDDASGGADVISARDLQDRQSQKAASRRASAIGAILRYDLNGDLKVTASEVLNAQTTDSQRTHAARSKASTDDLAARQPRLAKIEAERIMQHYDANRDGAIDMTEIAIACDAEELPFSGNGITVLLQSQLGRDGKVTRNEVKTLAQRTFKTFDTDKDGRISETEYEAVNLKVARL